MLRRNIRDNLAIERLSVPLILPDLLLVVGGHVDLELAVAIEVREVGRVLEAPGLLVDDSGPVLDNTALAPCLQAGWRR